MYRRQIRQGTAHREADDEGRLMIRADDEVLCVAQRRAAAHRRRLHRFLPKCRHRKQRLLSHQAEQECSHLSFVPSFAATLREAHYGGRQEAGGGARGGTRRLPACRLPDAMCLMRRSRSRVAPRILHCEFAIYMTVLFSSVSRLPFTLQDQSDPAHIYFHREYSYHP